MSSNAIDDQRFFISHSNTIIDQKVLADDIKKLQKTLPGILYLLNLDSFLYSHSKTWYNGPLIRHQLQV